MAMAMATLINYIFLTILLSDKIYYNYFLKYFLC